MFELKRPFVMFIYGLPCSGKESIAKNVKEKIDGNVVHIDRDSFKKETGINKSLGFSKEDRIENYNRVIDSIGDSYKYNTSLIFSIVLPYNSVRNLNREKFIGKYIQVYLDCPLFECERRDVNGLYKKARLEETNNFIGINGNFEASEDNDLVIETEHLSIDFCGDLIIRYLCDAKFLA